MIVCEFSVPGRPRSKGSPNVITKDRYGRRLAHPRVQHDTEHSAKYARVVASAARIAMRADPMIPLGVPLRVDIAIYLERPKSRKRDVWAPVTPDRDKVERLVFDAMEGIVFANDAQVVSGETSKFYAANGEPPRLNVTVRRLPRDGAPLLGE